MYFSPVAKLTGHLFSMFSHTVGLHLTRFVILSIVSLLILWDYAEEWKLPERDVRDR